VRLETRSLEAMAALPSEKFTPVLHGAGRVISRAADVTIPAGAENRLKCGSQSTPAAVLTLTATSAAGFVVWPILLAVSGAVLLIEQLKRHSDATTPSRAAAGAPTADQTSRPGGAAT
jgi:hypothetical protein